MTPRELFEQKAPEIFKSEAAKLKGVKGVYFLDIQGPDGGSWTLDFDRQPPEVRSGKPDKADCTITMSQEDFMTLVQDFSQAMRLFTSGKLKVDNPMAALRLQKVLPLLSR